MNKPKPTNLQVLRLIDFVFGGLVNYVNILIPPLTTRSLLTQSTGSKPISEKSSENLVNINNTVTCEIQKC